MVKITAKTKKLDVDMILIDLDDTLVTFGHTEISALNKTAIKQTQELGKEVVICTGRSYANSLGYAQALKLQYLICYGGAAVYNVQTQKIIYLNKMSQNDTNKAFSILAHDHEQLFLNIYAVNKQGEMKSFYYGTPNADFLSHKISLNSIEKLSNLTKLQEWELYKMNIFANDQLLKPLQKELSAAGLYVVQNYHNVLEVTDITVNKGFALQQLAAYLNIPLQKTMVIGDSYNDVSMFLKAGYGIAVANAVAKLKAISFAQTAAFDQSGVGKALLRWIIP